MAIRYSRTQPGKFIRVLMAGGVVLFSLLIIANLALWGGPAGGRVAVTAGFVVGLVTIVLVTRYFWSMTVEVTDDELRWHFGWGSGYRIARSDIESAQAERHPWWSGYGIRMRGVNRWTYIVTGRDVVEVRLRRGGWRRLGTDDPQGLLAALTAAGP